MVAELRQLPRGLAPLADESLPGYVLRLAHRLGTAPGDIAARTGLSERPAGLLPLGFLHAVGTDTAQVFAQVTRLTPEEVSGLGLATFSPRYGPLDLSHTPQKVTRSVINNNPWAYFRSTRYCSHCLAGDGSEIQQRHGGPWQRLWRLPVVFACLKHRCFLRHRCPACDQPVQFTARTRSLIPAPETGACIPLSAEATRDRPAPIKPPPAATHSAPHTPTPTVRWMPSRTVNSFAFSADSSRSSRHRTSTPRAASERWSPPASTSWTCAPSWP